MSNDTQESEEQHEALVKYLLENSSDGTPLFVWVIGFLVLLGWLLLAWVFFG